MRKITLAFKVTHAYRHMGKLYSPRSLSSSLLPVARFFGRLGLTVAHLLVSVVRIDHVLVNDRFAPLESYVVPAGYGSDHRPVVAMLRFVDKSRP